MAEVTDAELLAAVRDLKRAVESGQAWIDRKGLVLFALGALLAFGGSWTAMSVQVAEVRSTVAGIAKDVERVERNHDDLERDYNAHVRAPHAATNNGVRGGASTSALPLSAHAGGR